MSTVRGTEQEAWDAGCVCEEAAFHSGASRDLHVIPNSNPKIGSRSKLEAQGYRVAPVTITATIEG